MNEHVELFRGKVFTLYAQVGLVDVEAQDAYPQWKSGNEILVFGNNGVAVATAGDTYVDVIVYKGEIEPPPHKLCVSGEILIGKMGILVGNIPAASITHLPLPKGKYSVVIYTDGIGSDTHSVYFYINCMSSGRWTKDNTT